LRALATRAMRAEARIKLLEENRKSDNAHSSPPANAVDYSPSPSPAATSPPAPRPMDLPSNSTLEANWRTFGEGDLGNGGPGSGVSSFILCGRLSEHILTLPYPPLASSSHLARPRFDFFQYSTPELVHLFFSTTAQLVLFVFVK